MAKKPLTVHKNTARERRYRQNAERMVKSAKFLADTKEVSGYAIVMWTDDFRSNSAYVIGDRLPPEVMPDYVRTILRDEMVKSVYDPDWEPDPI